MQDLLIRGTALEGKVRVLAATTTQLVQQLHETHKTMQVASAALGRTATMGALMGAMLKGEEKLTLQIKGDGPLGQIVVDANANGQVRGYVEHPEVDLPTKPNGKIDVSGGVGEGFIYVIKDLGLREPYRGSTPIVSGEIAEDFTYYFAKSEQTPSIVSLGVLVDKNYSIKVAGGFVIQLLPGVSEADIDEIEQRLVAFRPITEMLEEGLSLDEIIQKLLPDFVRLEEQTVVFQCQCSRDRVERTLISLGETDVREIIEEQGEAEVACHFCNTFYQFNQQQLEDILERILK